MTTTATPPRAGLVAWVGLGLLTIPVFMTAIDMTVLFLASPTIAAELAPSATEQLWMLHVGDLVGAGLVLTAGRLVDRFGPRRLLVISALAYGGANLLAAYAPSIGVLVGARALIGAVAVSMMPAGMALLRRMFVADRQFSLAVAIFMAAFSGGVALGPPVGGVLLEHFWWGSIFLVNLPIAMIVVGFARVLPQVPGTGTGRVDVTSVLLSLGAVALVVYGGQELAAEPSWTHAVLTVVGLGLGAAFIRRQRTAAEPLLDLSLFRSRPFTLGLLAIVLVIVATAGADMQLAQHLQVVLGHSPLTAGLVLVVPATFSIVTTVAASALLRWVRPSVVMGVGVLAAAGGAALMVARAGEGTSAALVPTIGAVSLIAAGVAPVFSVATNVVVVSVPVERTGSAMASQDVGGSLGNTLGLAVGGMIAFVGYQGTMKDSLPGGLHPASREVAMEGIGPALATTDALPDELGRQLADAAAEAFAVGTGTTYVFATVGLTLLAVLILWGLRHARVDTGADGADDELTDAVPDPAASDASSTAR